MNALAYHCETLYVSSAPCPDVLKTFLGRFDPDYLQTILEKSYGFRVDIRNNYRLTHKQICWNDSKLCLRLYLCKALAF